VSLASARSMTNRAGPSLSPDARGVGCRPWVGGTWRRPACTRRGACRASVRRARDIERPGPRVPPRPRPGRRDGRDRLRSVRRVSNHPSESHRRGNRPGWSSGGSASKWRRAGCSCRPSPAWRRSPVKRRAFTRRSCASRAAPRACTRARRRVPSPRAGRACRPSAPGSVPAAAPGGRTRRR